MRAYWAGPRHPFLEFSPFGAGTLGTTIKFFRNYHYGPDDNNFVNDPNLIQVVYDDGKDCPNLNLENAIINQFQAIEIGRYQYNINGPNSNSTAFQVLRSLGIIDRNFEPPTGILSPGWESNPHEGETNNVIEDIGNSIIDDLIELGYPTYP